MSDVVYLDTYRPAPAAAYERVAYRGHAGGLVKLRQPYSPEDRDLRQKEWAVSLAQVEYFAALRALTDALVVASAVGLWDAKWDGHRPPLLHGIDDKLQAQAMEIVIGHRVSMYELIMTPAPFASSVTRKENIRRSSNFQFMGMTVEEFDAQIAADEAFLKACPRRPKGSLRGN